MWTKVGKEVKACNPYSLLVEMKVTQFIQKTVSVPQKVKHQVPSDLAILAIDTLPRDLKIHVNTKSVHKYP